MTQAFAFGYQMMFDIRSEGEIGISFFLSSLFFILWPIVSLAVGWSRSVYLQVCQISKIKAISIYEVLFPIENMGPTLHYIEPQANPKQYCTKK